MEVRINDRGPFIDGRVIDLSYAAAQKIEMVGPGLANVHLQLLEIGRKSLKSLVVRDHRLRGVAENIAVPDAEKSHQHRNVIRDRRFTKMAVHVMAAGEKFDITLGSDGDCQRQADA